VLTKEEQRTVVFIVLALVLGLWTKHYRAQDPPAPNESHAPALPGQGLPSPSPGMRP
jgi:hypothetical protein